jgi:hypothetical protein
MAFQTLCAFLIEGVAPSRFIRLSPHIVLKSNLHIFLERIQPGWDKGLAATGDPAMLEGQGQGSSAGLGDA